MTGIDAGIDARTEARTDAATDKQAAMVRVFIAQRRRLLSVATRILGCPSQAEDVVHDAYLKLCQTLPHERCLCEASYVCRVVRNVALDSYRRQQLEKRLFAPDYVETEVPLDTNSPDRIAIDREQQRGLRNAMRALPPRTRDAVVQYYFGDQTQRCIAERLGISPTMVNFILQDARTALGAMHLSDQASAAFARSRPREYHGHRDASPHTPDDRG